MKPKKYKLQDGGIITASSPEEFVTKLRESSKFDSDCTDQEYMKNFSKRCEIQTGAIIRIETASFFVQDLQDTGYLE